MAEDLEDVLLAELGCDSLAYHLPRSRPIRLTWSRKRLSESSQLIISSTE